MKDRMERVNALIQRELGTIFERSLEFPQGCFVTVTHVETARDLRTAVAGVSVLPIEKRTKVEELLQQHAGEIQHALGLAVASLRYIPKVTFRIDEQEERAERLNRLIDSVSPTEK